MTIWCTFSILFWNFSVNSSTTGSTHRCLNSAKSSVSSIVAVRAKQRVTLLYSILYSPFLGRFFQFSPHGAQTPFLGHIFFIILYVARAQELSNDPHMIWTRKFSKLNTLGAKRSIFGQKIFIFFSEYLG